MQPAPSIYIGGVWPVAHASVTCCSCHCWLCLRSSIAQYLVGVLVQWQLLRELAKEFLCGHWNSLGTGSLLDDAQCLCVNWLALALLVSMIKPCWSLLVSSCEFLLQSIACPLGLSHASVVWIIALVLLSQSAPWSHGVSWMSVALDKPGWSCQ